MRIEKKLTEFYNFWTDENCHSYLCSKEVRKLFKIPKKTKVIYGVLSSRKLSESYLLTCDDRWGNLTVDGEVISSLYTLRCLIANQFNGRCYGRIEYD